MYLGSKLNNKDIKHLINSRKLGKKFIIKNKFKPKEIAIELKKGRIIGRCAGRMEFGLRSLGNRSILCDPRFSENINKINFKIKKKRFLDAFHANNFKRRF